MRISDWSSDVCSSDLLQAEQAAVTADYDNRVLLDVDDHCMRLAVFEGEYRWHQHPESDELFLVVAGTLEIDIDGGERITLAPWQAAVIPAGTVHRTRAVGRTVNATFERQGARARSEEHTSELQSLMRISYAVFCLK